MSDKQGDAAPPSAGDTNSAPVPGDTNSAPVPGDTDFGYARVPVGEKQKRVRAVFDSVAPSYDVMNDIMSFGVHRLWKRELVRALEPGADLALLDLAAGTGDISFGWLAAGGGRAVLADINASMLAVGATRAARLRLDARCDIVVADAERLPIADRSADRVSMAFGLRNCTSKEAVLAEVRRVLRPGGRFLCLEFSRVQIAPLAPVYDAWSFAALPRIGAIVAKDADSYRYLAESIRLFPHQERLADMMRAAGLARVSWRNLSGGIAAIHTGWRL